MRKIFIYISLIALTATFTLGETFAKAIVQNFTEDVDFADEKESELKEEYTEAVFDSKQVQVMCGSEIAAHYIFCEKETAATASGFTAATNNLYLLNCQILR